MNNKILIAAVVAGVALTGCKEEYDPIVPIEPGQKEEVTYDEFLSRAESTYETLHDLYWSEKAQMMFSKYPNSMGTGLEPSTPEYSDHAMIWGYGAVVSAFATIVQTTSNLEFRTK